MLGNDEDLMKRIKDAGEKTFERVWQLPMWEEYASTIKGDVADINNVGNKSAGTIIGAIFLGNFVEKTPWVHLDIAGTSFVSKEGAYVPKGGTGVGVRLLAQFLKDYCSDMK